MNRGKKPANTGSGSPALQGGEDVTIRRPLTATLGIALALAVGVSCSNGGAEDPAGAGQFGATTTTEDLASTTAADTTSTTVLDPETEDEFADLERDHDHSDEDVVWLDGNLGDIDRSDPESVASAWGCALRAKPAGEDSDAWLFRLAGPLTDGARAKLASLSSPADDNTQLSRLIGASVDDEDSPQTWTVRCAAEIRDPQGDVIAVDSTTPVTVVLARSPEGWAVDDFAWGGIELG